MGASVVRTVQVYRNVQATVTLAQAPSTPVAGFFRLSLPTLNPNPTDWLAFDASTATVAAALQAIAPSLGSIGVSRWHDQYDGSDWVIHYWNHRGDVEELVQVDVSRLTGGSGGDITQETFVQRNGTSAERFYGPITGDWLRTAEVSRRRVQRCKSCASDW